MQKLQSLDFQGKVVLVTGAAKGMGKVIAQTFSEQNATVAVTDISDQEGIEVAKDLKDRGKEADFFHLDVADRPNAERVVKEIEAKWSRIDIVVNNAGVVTLNLAVDLTDKEWDYVMDINAKGVFIISQLIVRQMIKKSIKGKIINIASISSKKGDPLASHYSASKFAVVGFSQGLALEVAKYGINVNSVCPSFVGNTAMNEWEVEWEVKAKGIPLEEVIRSHVKDVPLGRQEQPDDVAKVVLFLASNLSDYMTGQAINVTGGTCMH